MDIRSTKVKVTTTSTGNLQSLLRHHLFHPSQKWSFYHQHRMQLKGDLKFHSIPLSYQTVLFHRQSPFGSHTANKTISSETSRQHCLSELRNHRGNIINTFMFMITAEPISNSFFDLPPGLSRRDASQMNFRQPHFIEHPPSHSDQA